MNKTINLMPMKLQPKQLSHCLAVTQLQTRMITSWMIRSAQLSAVIRIIARLLNQRRVYL